MQAGLLNKIIIIESPIIIKDDFGGEVTSYKEIYTTKAQKKDNSGDMITANNEVVYTNNVTFTVRKYVTVNEHCRIKYKDKYYRINHIEDNDKLQTIIITTELINE